MLNLAVLKKIVSAAALAGLFAGLLLTGLQQFRVVPAILEAEIYEQASATGHEHNKVMSDDHDHEDHDHQGWQPQDGAERTTYTALSNVTMGFGFALLLAALMSLQNQAIGWRKGVVWGAAGYATFFLAPAIGLPPDLPGTEAASLVNRQLWWLLTAGATASGLALLFFSRGWIFKIVAAGLIAVPHLLGAPQPDVHSSTAPNELIVSFFYATAITNVIFWLVLGALTAFFFKKAA